MFHCRILVSIFFNVMAISWSLKLYAEPWLGTRFAQNCSGCHAPGRKNLEPIDRRCSLSCQGCHVNPNGGGLRSHYGKWNEDRWLRSFVIQGLPYSKAPAPYNLQHYAKAEKKSSRDNKGRKSRDFESKGNKDSDKDRKNTTQHGLLECRIYW